MPIRNNTEFHSPGMVRVCGPRWWWQDHCRLQENARPLAGAFEEDLVRAEKVGLPKQVNRDVQDRLSDLEEAALTSWRAVV